MSVPSAPFRVAAVQMKFAADIETNLRQIDGVLCTAIFCRERRYPELVRLGVMAGAKIVFHPNTALDTIAVSREKRGGLDGIAVRAFESPVFYAFANSVGP